MTRIQAGMPWVPARLALTMVLFHIPQWIRVWDEVDEWGLEDEGSSSISSYFYLSDDSGACVSMEVMWQVSFSGFHMSEGPCSHAARWVLTVLLLFWVPSYRGQGRGLGRRCWQVVHIMLQAFTTWIPTMMLATNSMVDSYWKVRLGCWVRVSDKVMVGLHTPCSLAGLSVIQQWFFVVVWVSLFHKLLENRGGWGESGSLCSFLCYALIKKLMLK